MRWCCAATAAALLWTSAIAVLRVVPPEKHVCMVSFMRSKPGCLLPICPEGGKDGRCCPKYQIDCPDHRCIKNETVCDGKDDCVFGEEERGCKDGPCKPDSCEHKCTEYNGKYKCSCNEGFKLDSNQKNCLDIDECHTESWFSGTCTHECVNTHGGYHCLCPDGFEHNDTLKGGCVLTDKNMLVLYANGSSIWAMDVERSVILEVVQAASVTSLDHDHEMLFWVEERRRVYRSYMVGALGVVSRGYPQRLPINTDESEDVGGLAVDWLAGTLYWSESSKIKVGRTDGTSVAALRTLPSPPSSLIVDPLKGLLYWYRDGHIEFAPSGHTTKFLTKINCPHLTAPYAVSLDRIAKDNRVYYLQNDTIYSVSIWVRAYNIHIVLNEGSVGQVQSMDLFEHYIYLATNNSLKMVEVHGRGGVRTLADSLTNVTVVRVYQEERWPRARPPTKEQCLPGTCQALCLHSESSTMCTCPDAGCGSESEPKLPAPVACQCDDWCQEEEGRVVCTPVKPVLHVEPPTSSSHIILILSTLFLVLLVVAVALYASFRLPRPVRFTSLTEDT